MKVIYIVLMALLIGCSSPVEPTGNDPCTYEDVSYVQTIHGVRTMNDTETEYMLQIRENETGTHKLLYYDEDQTGSEQYLIGEDFYHRERTHRDEWSDWEKAHLPGVSLYTRDLPNDSQGSMFCGEQSVIDVKYLGEDTLGMTKVRRYSASLPEDVLVDTDLSVDFEFWVDSSGRLHKSVKMHRNKYFVDETVSSTTNHGEDFEIVAPEALRTAPPKGWEFIR